MPLVIICLLGYMHKGIFQRYGDNSLEIFHAYDSHFPVLFCLAMVFGKLVLSISVELQALTGKLKTCFQQHIGTAALVLSVCLSDCASGIAGNEHILSLPRHKTPLAEYKVLLFLSLL